MLAPGKVKYRYRQKGRMRGKAIHKGGTIEFGDYGLQAMEPGTITARQIEAARIAITRYLKKGGKIWIRIFPDKPLTSKPAETRMGKGKGSIDQWALVVKKGRILYEIEGVSEELAKEALRRAGNKLPVVTRFVKRSGMRSGI